MFLGLFNRHLTTTVAQSGNEGHGQAGNGSGGSQTGTRAEPVCLSVASGLAVHP